VRDEKKAKEGKAQTDQGSSSERDDESEEKRLKMKKHIGPYDQTFDFRREHRRFIRFSILGCLFQIEMFEINEKGDQVPIDEKYICSVKDLPDLINGLRQLTDYLALPSSIFHCFKLKRGRFRLQSFKEWMTRPKNKFDIFYEERGEHKMLRVLDLQNRYDGNPNLHVLLEERVINPNEQSDENNLLTVNPSADRICFRSETLSQFISALQEVQKKKVIDIYDSGRLTPIRISLTHWEGLTYIDIRWCEMIGDKTIAPDKADPESLPPSVYGIHLPIEFLPQLIEGLKKFETELER
jgi:hypothetical protein